MASSIFEFTGVVSRWNKILRLHKLVSLIGCATTLLISRLIVKKVRANVYKYPPQLYGLPFVGSLVTMQIYKERFMSELLPSYGDIVRYSVGTTCAYQINNAELMKKVFAKAFDRNMILQDLWSSLGLAPGVATINGGHDHDLRRRAIMSSLSKVLDKLSCVLFWYNIISCN